eukprot:1189287-Prorocentrum_minimum.AAC.1
MPVSAEIFLAQAASSSASHLAVGHCSIVEQNALAAFIQTVHCSCATARWTAASGEYSFIQTVHRSCATGRGALVRALKL